MKKQCFKSMKGTPPESNKVAGALSNLEREGEGRKSCIILRSLNIIISCEVGGERSFNGKPF